MDYDRLIALKNSGFWSVGLGPDAEWDPESIDEHQELHNAFWGLVRFWVLIEEVDYDDLPDWMTEVGANALTDNN